MEFQNRTAVVTGASEGIGRAIAEALGTRGARVAICARRAEPLEEAAAGLRGRGVDVFSRPCDVSEREEVENFFAAVQERWERVDILVNNAGVGGPTPIHDPRDDRWHTILSVTLDGSFFCSRCALRTMPEGGRIINFSSVLGRFGVPGYTAYCSAKHGILGFTRALALEVAPRGITVNAICPGWVETTMAREGMEAGAKGMGVAYEEFRREALENVPLKEIIPPEEIAGLVCYLASPQARNVTGQAYNLCGGQTMD